MKTITIAEANRLMLDALRIRDIEKYDAEFIVNDYLDAEMEGNKTHGISKFLTIDNAISKREGDLEITLELNSIMKIDGHKELGHIAMRYASQRAVELARKTGMALVGVSNVSRYSRLSPYAKIIADEGMVGIISNNGGPACAVPFQGTQPIFGTNPICFGFPGKEEIYVFDFSTAQNVWGSIRQSIVEGKNLPGNSFLNSEGKYTTNPHEAVAVNAFGGAKGYTLMYAIEVLTGALIGCKMGTQLVDEYDLGITICVVSPEVFGSLSDFKESVDRLARDVRNSKPFEIYDAVYVPGDRSRHKKAEVLCRGYIEIEDDIYERLVTMSQSLDGGFCNTKLFN